MQHVWLDWIITIPALAVATVFVVRKAMTATWLQPDPELARELISRGIPLLGDPEFRTWQVAPVRTWVLRAAWIVCALGCARALHANAMSIARDWLENSADATLDADLCAILHERATAAKVMPVDCGPTPGDGPFWKFETELPRATFMITDNGHAWCEGFVFALTDLPELDFDDEVDSWSYDQARIADAVRQLRGLGVVDTSPSPPRFEFALLYSGDTIPDWVPAGDDRDEIADLLSDKYGRDPERGYLLLLRPGGEFEWHMDGGEPEDNSFARDLSWVIELLEELASAGGRA